MKDSSRLARYAERFFQRRARTAWPTVREAARSLGWTQQRVSDAVDGDSDSRLSLTAYYTSPEQVLGEHFVEVT